VTTSIAIRSVTVAEIISPTKSLTGPTWMVSPYTDCWAEGKKAAIRGVTRLRVSALKKSLKAPPTNIATEIVRSSGLILYIPHRLFFTVWSHSDHSEKGSGCSENPMQYLTSKEPEQKVPPNACVRHIRREHSKKDCSKSIADRETHEPIGMKPLSGNAECIRIGTRHLTFRTRM